MASGKRSKPSPQTGQEQVPDVNAPNFRAEAHRQSLAVANSPGASDDQAFIDAVSVSIWDDE